MSGAAGCPPPQALARMDKDGARALVEVLSRPDVQGRVQISCGGERSVVPARWLEPVNEVARDLLTSADLVVKRDAPAPPKPVDELRVALASAMPIAQARAATLLGVEEPPNGPDRYLLSADERRLFLLCGDEVLSVHTLEPRVAAASAPAPPRRERTPRLRGEMVIMGRAGERPGPGKPAAPPAPAPVAPKAPSSRARLAAERHPQLGCVMAEVHVSDGIHAHFPSRAQARMAVFQAVPLDGDHASMRVGRRELTICYRQRQYLDRPPQGYAVLEGEDLPPLQEGERWLDLTEAPGPGAEGAS